MRPRLADAKFFFDQDRKKPLARRASPSWRNVVYHNKLGTQGERVAARAQRWPATSPASSAPTRPQAERAALLAKADLLTDMVGEFPELQGIMGRYYALHDGEPADVADAIEDHYQPRFAGDALPQRQRRPAPSRWPTSSKPWSASSASARCRPATRIPSACAALRSACCAS